jgi:hypothetical protein
MGFPGAVAPADPGDLASAKGQADVVEDRWLWALPFVVEPLQLQNRLARGPSGGWLGGGWR